MRIVAYHAATKENRREEDRFIERRNCMAVLIMSNMKGMFLEALVSTLELWKFI